MRILVVGAYGLVGSVVTSRLLVGGCDVVGVGRDAGVAQRRFPQVNWVARDLRSMTLPSAWLDLLAGVDAVVNCAGALQESRQDKLTAVHLDAPKALVLAAEAVGVRCIVHVSAAGVSAASKTEFFTTKHDFELFLGTREKGIILRPGLVFAAQAYGGSALLRGLAGFPFMIPVMRSKARLQIVSAHDVAETVWRAVQVGAPERGSYDLVHQDPLRLEDVLQRLRAWLGFAPAPVIQIPSFVAMVVARCADASAALGWRSPLRTTSILQLQDGIVGDGAAWRNVFGVEAQSLDAMLSAAPSGVQERWFARAYFVKPLSLMVLSAFWVFSGLMGVFRLEEAASVLLSAGWSDAASKVAVLSGSLLDIALGCAVASRAAAPLALIGMVLTSLAYLSLGTLVRPDLWLDPLGSFLKVVPGALLALATLALMDER